jgi:hypothetical protein
MSMADVIHIHFFRDVMLFREMEQKLWAGSQPRNPFMCGEFFIEKLFLI